MKLIDTSSWIHALRPDGDESIRERVRGLLNTGNACWCPMVRLELWNGARGRHEKIVLDEMALNLPGLPVTEEVWISAYALAQKTREKGHTIPATDILIASCARCHNVDIEHSDSHFDILADL